MPIGIPPPLMFGGGAGDVMIGCGGGICTGGPSGVPVPIGIGPGGPKFGGGCGENP